MAATTHGDQQIVLTGEPDHVDDVTDACTASDQRGSLVDMPFQTLRAPS
jgi:hypothetical protein